jgi:hypothetical protein
VVSGSLPLGRLVVVLVASIALGAGCSSDGDDDVVTIRGEELRLVTLEPAGDDVELVDYTSSAMGGVRFSMDPAHHLHIPGDTIVVSISDPAEEAGWEVASIGLLTQTADGVAIDSVDQVLDLIAATPSAVVTATGTAIELLDHQLAGYDIRADASTRDLYVFSGDRVGSPPMALLSYFPNGRIFLAETPAGVLVAASAEADEVANIEAIDTALGTLMASIELTGGVLEEPLPPGQALELDDIRDSEARGELDPDGPEALEAPFSPVEPGTYQLANLGPTFTLDFSDDWHVQPNFPGYVVLTSPGSGGPGDQDLTFVTGVVDVVPIGAGPVRAGEPIPVADVDAVVDALSSDLEVTGVTAVDLGGVEATQFDVRIPADSPCTQDEPCEYAVRTSSGVVKQFRSTHAHRIWWIDDGAEGPSMVVAMTALGDDFIDRATELLTTISFN